MTPFLENEVTRMIERLEALKAEPAPSVGSDAAAGAYALVDASARSGSGGAAVVDATAKPVKPLRRVLLALAFVFVLVVSVVLMGCGSGGGPASQSVPSATDTGASGYNSSGSSSYDSPSSVTSEPTPTAAPDATASSDSESAADPSGSTSSGGTTAATTSTSTDDGGETAQAPERKLIVNMSYDLETKDMDATLNSLESAVQASGGFIESSEYSGYSDSDYYRYATLVCRVPASGVEAFKAEVEAAGNVVAESASGEDVSYEYYDTEGRLEVLRTEESRLLEILETSGTITEMLEVENELSRVREEIETLTGTLKKYDDLVDMATVSISVQNVSDYSPPAAEKSFWDKLAEAFIDSCAIALNIAQGLIISLVYMLPYLVVIGVVVLVIVLLVKRSGKRKRKKLAAMPAPSNQVPMPLGAAGAPASAPTPAPASTNAAASAPAPAPAKPAATQLPLGHPPIGQPPENVTMKKEK